MIVDANVTIAAPPTEIWAAITDIENASSIIGGIERVEVVERPATGLVGLRWRETRRLFDQPAMVEKRITAATDNELYTTEAEDGGFLFVTTHRISAGSGGATLSARHESRPRNLVARFMVIPMALFFKGAIRKAALRDLNDVKTAVEARRGA